MWQKPQAPESQACTQEAKQCPDGSYVSRTGPNCEFAECPEVRDTATIISPNGGESYKVGDMVTIRWEGKDISGKLNNNLRIYWESKPTDGKPNQSGWIANNQPVTGSFDWKIRDNITPDPHYYIALQGPVLSMTDANVLDHSDAPFAIVMKDKECTDTDGGKKYSARGVINFVSYDASGNINGKTDVGDECVDAIIAGEMRKNVLREYYCDNNTRVQFENYVCPYGCASGACRAKPVLIEATYSYPYPLSWEENDIAFSLTGVSLGKILAPSGTMNSSGGNYRADEEIYALVFDLKITNKSSSGAGALLNLRRLLSEEGDMVSPNTRQFMFPGVGGYWMQPNITYEHQKVIFVVPETLREFNITTGGESNIFFTVSIGKDNTIKVAKTVEAG